MRKTTIAVSAIVTTVLFYSCKKNDYVQPITATPTPESMVDLGDRLFFDNSLSSPAGQSCGSCHAMGTAFSDPSHNMVSPGIVSGLFGNRNAPTATYTKFNPVFHYSPPDSSYVGGLFVDGRVNTLEEQAQKPFLNPLEMGNVSVASVITNLENSPSYPYYVKVFGEVGDINTAYNNMASAIAAFERSDTLNAFTSKFDYYMQGKASLTAEEQTGMNLFMDTNRAKCVNCHLITPDAASGKILFTDFSYENDGVPKNTYNPYYTIPSTYNPLGYSYIDLGLGAIISDSNYYGTFRTPTLRNVAVTAPYFHNGVFGTLEEVVHFYNTRDVAGAGWPAPEYASTIDHVETGNQGLSAAEEADIVAFLKTLTDGYNPTIQ